MATPLAPSRNTVLALIAYVALGFAATVAAGDLGDIGFWIVWIPIAAIVVYLPVVALAAIVRAARRR